MGATTAPTLLENIFSCLGQEGRRSSPEEADLKDLGGAGDWIWSLGLYQANVLQVGGISLSTKLQIVVSFVKRSLELHTYYAEDEKVSMRHGGHSLQVDKLLEWSVDFCIFCQYLLLVLVLFVLFLLIVLESVWIYKLNDQLLCAKLEKIRSWGKWERNFVTILLSERWGCEDIFRW